MSKAVNTDNVVDDLISEFENMNTTPGKAGDPPLASAGSVKQSAKDKLLKDAATEEFELMSNKGSSVISGDKGDFNEHLLG